MNRAIRTCGVLVGAGWIVAVGCSSANQASSGAATDSPAGTPAVSVSPPLSRDGTLPADGGATAPGAGMTPLPTSDAATRPGAAGGGAGPSDADQQRLGRLEREARAIANTTGCSSASACRSAPVGAKACGGPRTYLVYCAATTDTVKLFAKLRELEQAEKAYNRKAGMMSTCEMRLPPQVALVGGSCRESASAQPGPR